MPKLKLTEKKLAELPPPPDGTAQVTYYDETLTGFAVVVGRKSRTFVVVTRTGGRKVKVTIGRAGAIRGDGLAWTAMLARKRAQEILGKAAAGELGNDKPDTSKGPTLREGLELHVEAMRRLRRSDKSIKSIRGDVTKHLAAWLDQQLVELTAVELDAACKAVMAAARPQPGAVNPPGAAVAKRLLAHVSAIWTSTEKLHDLPARNPAKRVTAHRLLPKQARVDDTDLPDWYRRVQTLSPVRRDLQLFALFTGLRSESARSLRWEDVDLERGLVHITKAKGDRPYTIPISRTHIELLERRRRENPIEFGPHGGDHGWVFPSTTSRYPFHVQPVAETKEIRRDQKTGQVYKYLPGIHPLRRTFNSVAMEIGIQLEDREALMNHNGQGVNLRVYTVPQRWEHLAACQAKIEVALWERLGQRHPDEKPKTERALRVLKGGKGP